MPRISAPCTRWRSVGLLSFAAALALSGCVTPASPETPPPAAPTVDAEAILHPDGTAEQNRAFFAATLQSFVVGEADVTGRRIVDALVDAGFPKSHMQVSFDRTKTDLVADAIYVSVRIDEDCLVGQVQTGSRETTTEVLGAVGPDTDLCLIGKTRPITW